MPLPNLGAQEQDKSCSRSPIPLEVSMNRVLSLLIVVFGLTAVAAGASEPTKINGWVSDSMCGAKHTGTGKTCVKKCIEGGAAPVFVDEAKKAVWTIDNPDAVKAFYGDHVNVTATANADKKSVHIDAIAEAK
jgi:hypothetical protein